MSDINAKTQEHMRKVAQALELIDHNEIQRIIERLREARKAGGFVWIVGNGGSAATASHFANDLVKMAGIRAIAVGDQGPTVFAFGNDEGWEDMFAGALKRWKSPSDVLCAISCSGESENVIQAVRIFGPDFFSLTGQARTSRLADLARMSATPIVYTHSPEIKVQEDLHMIVCHAIVEGL